MRGVSSRNLWRNEADSETYCSVRRRHSITASDAANAFTSGNWTLRYPGTLPLTLAFGMASFHACPSYKFRPVQKSWSFRVMPDSVGGMPAVLLHGVVSASQLRLLP